MNFGSEIEALYSIMEDWETIDHLLLKSRPKGHSHRVEDDSLGDQMIQAA